MDHLQVSVLALRETIDRQQDRLDDLELQRAALLAVILIMLLLVVSLPVILQLPFFCERVHA